jgi:hypothetical protein
MMPLAADPALLARVDLAVAPSGYAAYTKAAMSGSALEPATRRVSQTRQLLPHTGPSFDSE